MIGVTTVLMRGPPQPPDVPNLVWQSDLQWARCEYNTGTLDYGTLIGANFLVGAYRG